MEMFPNNILCLALRLHHPNSLAPPAWEVVDGRKCACRFQPQNGSVTIRAGTGYGAQVHEGNKSLLEKEGLSWRPLSSDSERKQL
jgi:hypothetical protein